MDSSAYQVVTVKLMVLLAVLYLLKASNLTLVYNLLIFGLCEKFDSFDPKKSELTNFIIDRKKKTF